MYAQLRFFFNSVKIILKWFNKYRKSPYSNLLGKIFVKLIIIIQTEIHTSTSYIILILVQVKSRAVATRQVSVYCHFKWKMSNPDCFYIYQ